MSRLKKAERALTCYIYDLVSSPTHLQYYTYSIIAKKFSLLDRYLSCSFQIKYIQQKKNEYGYKVMLKYVEIKRCINVMG